MVSPNWSIMGMARDPGQAFGNAFAEGLKRREEQDGKNALAALVANPSDPQAMQTAARYDPGFALQARGQAQQAEAAGIEQHRENIVKGAQIIRQVNPQDEAGWQRALAIAAQAGISLAGVPQQFDPQYVQGLTALADTFAPQDAAKPDLVVIDGVAIDKRTGQPVFESPYDRIIPGQGGSFYRVPRMGIGREGQGQPPQGAVVQGELPPGWTLEEEEVPGQSGPATFP